mmetsp:Transcript_26329/g.65868  ORF Transcript_26329/g.65868 Transcript_26329/m.65868 type:complete len:876 (+) Transcript_26329:2005-4632(+)
MHGHGLGRRRRQRLSISRIRFKTFREVLVADRITAVHHVLIVDEQSEAVGVGGVFLELNKCLTPVEPILDKIPSSENQLVLDGVPPGVVGLPLLPLLVGVFVLELLTLLGQGLEFRLRRLRNNALVGIVRLIEVDKIVGQLALRETLQKGSHVRLGGRRTDRVVGQLAGRDEAASQVGREERPELSSLLFTKLLTLVTVALQLPLKEDIQKSLSTLLTAAEGARHVGNIRVEAGQRVVQNVIVVDPVVGRPIILRLGVTETKVGILRRAHLVLEIDCVDGVREAIAMRQKLGESHLRVDLELLRHDFNGDDQSRLNVDDTAARVGGNNFGHAPIVTQVNTIHHNHVGTSGKAGHPAVGITQDRQGVRLLVFREGRVNAEVEVDALSLERSFKVNQSLEDEHDVPLRRHLEELQIDDVHNHKGQLCGVCNGLGNLEGFVLIGMRRMNRPVEDVLRTSTIGRRRPRSQRIQLANSSDVRVDFGKHVLEDALDGCLIFGSLGAPLKQDARGMECLRDILVPNGITRVEHEHVVESDREVEGVLRIAFVLDELQAPIEAILDNVSTPAHQLLLNCVPPKIVSLRLLPLGKAILVRLPLGDAGLQLLADLQGNRRRVVVVVRVEVDEVVRELTLGKTHEEGRQIRPRLVRAFDDSQSNLGGGNEAVGEVRRQKASILRPVALSGVILGVIGVPLQLPRDEHREKFASILFTATEGRHSGFHRGANVVLRQNLNQPPLGSDPLTCAPHGACPGPSCAQLVERLGRDSHVQGLRLQRMKELVTKAQEVIDELVRGFDQAIGGNFERNDEARLHLEHGASDPRNNVLHGRAVVLQMDTVRDDSIGLALEADHSPRLITDDARAGARGLRGINADLQTGTNLVQ